MTSIITEKTVQNIIGRRKKEIHKGDCGRIMIAAGSRGMAGAAILAARSALRAGSGLVRTAIPAELFPVVQVGVPEATCIERRLPIQNLSDFDAICIGPGLGETKESIDFVKELLISYEKTLIVDADGLNIIAHQNLFDLLRHRGELYPERTILTPHMGEAKRLLAAPASPGSEPAAPPFDFRSAASAAERERIADALVRKTHAIIVLKGSGTLVAAEGRRTYTNTTGNPGMATGGSGDVLSGIITSLAGQRSQVGTELAAALTAKTTAVGTDLAAAPVTPETATAAGDGASMATATVNGPESAPASRTPQTVEAATCKPRRIGAFEAALAGVYIHGLAGDLAAAEFGEYGVTAGDLAHYTAYAIKKILSEV